MSPSKYSTVSFLALVGLIFLWANDTWECATRYLYFSSLIAVALVSAVVYFETFSTIPWNAPPEKDDNIPQPGWRRFSKELIIWFLFLTGLMFVSWLVTGFSTGFGTLPWFKRALWAGYMLGVYLICILLIRKYFAYIHAKAMAVATPVLVYLLSTYEIILLDRGVGWHYNNTVIGTVFGIPIDNVLFTYPISPVLAMMMYAIFTRNRNDKRAFWKINAILAPASIVFELIAVYPLDIWRVHKSQSVLPLGKTSLEEILFYVLMQFFSIALYAFLLRSFRKPIEK